MSKYEELQVLFERGFQTVLIQLIQCYRFNRT